MKLTRSLFLMGAALLAGCQTFGEQFSSPDVRLQNVRVQQADLITQRFVLDFAVANPNPVALPVQAINYGINLGGVSLASGTSSDGFRIPARGDGTFSISVETSLIEAAKVLGTRLLRSGERELPYDVGGSIDVGIPFVKPLPFNATGTVTINGL